MVSKKCRNYQTETRNKEEVNYIQQFSPIKYIWKYYISLRNNSTAITLENSSALG